MLALYLTDLIYHQVVQSTHPDNFFSRVPLKNAYNIDMFTRLLSIWSKSNSMVAVQRILEILFYMEHAEIFQRENTHDLRTVIGRLDTVPYNVAIKAWSVSDYPWKAEQAMKILNRIEERSIKYPSASRCLPDIISYTSVIEACHNTPVDIEPFRLKAIDILISVWEQLKSYDTNDSHQKVTISHSTYGSFIRAAGKLRAPSDLIEKAFIEARELGYASKFVISQFRKGVREDIFSKVINEQIDMKCIPTDWTRNVNDKRFKSRYHRSDPRPHPSSSKSQ